MRSSLAALALVFSLISGPVWAESAQRLVIEAEEAIVSSELEPEPVKQMALLKRALERFDRIVQEHPDNPLADQIVNGGKLSGVTRDDILARIARLRGQPEICFAEPGTNCLITISLGFSRKFAFLRDRVQADSKIAAALLELDNLRAAALVIDESLKSALRIKAPSGRARALGEVAAIQTQAGDEDGALQTLSHALKAARAIEPAGDRARALARVGESFIARDQRTQGREILRAAMADAPEVRSLDAKVELLTRLARFFVQADQMDEADLLVGSSILASEQIAQPYDRSWAMTLTAEALFATGWREQAKDDLEHAIELSAAITELQLRSSLVIRAARLFADWGEEDQANGILDRLLQDLQSVANPSDRAEVLWSIAEAHIKAGHTSDARLALDFALKEAVRTPVGRRADLLSRLALSLSATGDSKTARIAIKGALDTAETLQDPDLRARRLLAAAVSLAKLGAAKLAAETLTKVWEAGGYRDSNDARRLGMQPLLTIALALRDPAQPAAVEVVTPRN